MPFSVVEEFRIFSGWCQRLIETLTRRATKHRRRFSRPSDSVSNRGPLIDGLDKFCIRDISVTVGLFLDRSLVPPVHALMRDYSMAVVDFKLGWQVKWHRNDRMLFLSFTSVRIFLLISTLIISQQSLLSDRRSGVRFWYKHWLYAPRAILNFMTLKLPLKFHLMSNIITEYETLLSSSN